LAKDQMLPWRRMIQQRDDRQTAELPFSWLR